LNIHMKKILHLTDLHIGKDGCAEKFNKIVSNVTARLNSHDYVTVITGDLVDDSCDINEAVRQIKRLKVYFGNNNVLIAPGSYDYGSGVNGKSRLMQRFKRKMFGNDNEPFPRLDIINSIAFIGLDSTAEELDGLPAAGEIGRGQLNALKDLLNNNIQVLACSHKVVYLHHCLAKCSIPGHILKDHAALQRIARDKIDIFLFGHEHEEDAWIENRAWQIKHTHNGGASSGTHYEFGPLRIIDLSKDIDRGFY